ncbi:unnamed protein product [Cuscuta campestris]|uniref:Uncharacterized protein n=1 Tax=Cuscuta campestris TaxID=132261 RepID=A0A484MN23_9ASTE|nr:unnamed protein product [Cuscuta campestris]
MTPANPATWTHEPSIIREDELREVAALLGKGFRVHHPDAVGGISLSHNPNPQKYMVMQYHSMENGFRLPLHGLLRDICRHFRFAPGQLTANAHKYVASYILWCCALDRTPTLDEFLILFSIGGSFPFYNLYPHPHAPIFERVEFKNDKWSYRYFVIEFPAHSPLDLPGVILRSSISRTKFVAAPLAEEVYTALREEGGLIPHHSLQDARLYKKADFYYPLGPDPVPFEGEPSPERSKAPPTAESDPVGSSSGNQTQGDSTALAIRKPTAALEAVPISAIPGMRRPTLSQKQPREGVTDDDFLPKKNKGDGTSALPSPLSTSSGTQHTIPAAVSGGLELPHPDSLDREEDELRDQSALKRPAVQPQPEVINTSPHIATAPQGVEEEGEGQKEPEFSPAAEKEVEVQKELDASSTMEKEAGEQKGAEAPPETEIQRESEEQQEPKERRPAITPLAVNLPIRRKFTPQTYPAFREAFLRTPALRHPSTPVLAADAALASHTVLASHAGFFSRASHASHAVPPSHAVPVATPSTSRHHPSPPPPIVLHRLPSLFPAGPPPLCRELGGVSKMSPFENRELMYKKYEREGVVSQEWVDNVVEFVEYFAPTRTNSVLEEEPNSTDKQFFEMLKAADTDLWPGSSKTSQLSAVARLLNIKSEHNLSERCYDTICQYIKDILPEDNSMMGDNENPPPPTSTDSEVLARLRRSVIGRGRPPSRQGSSTATTSTGTPSITSSPFTDTQVSPSTPRTTPSGPCTSASRVGESIEDQDDGVGDDHDFEDCFGEGRSGRARDGEDEVHDNVDQQGGYHEGPSHHGQFVYVNSDDEVTITRAGAALITPAFYERTDATGFSWGKVSKTTKEFYFREFKKNARVDPSIDEGMLRKAFLRKAAERYASYTYNQRNPTRLKKKKMDPRPLEQLKKVWEEDPEFLELSKTKKKNRRKGKEDGPALGTYCGGSIPFSENMNRLAKKKGAPVQLDEVIIHTKTKKHDGKTWVDPGHAELQAQFFELREEARQNGLKVTDEEIWYSLVEGHNAKNRVPGVGDYAREMKKINPSSKPRRSSTSSSSAVEMAALKEQNQRLQEQLDNLTSNLSLTIQEEIRKLYGGMSKSRTYNPLVMLALA